MRRWLGSALCVAVASCGNDGSSGPPVSFATDSSSVDGEPPPGDASAPIDSSAGDADVSTPPFDPMACQLRAVFSGGLARSFDIDLDDRVLVCAGVKRVSGGTVDVYYELLEEERGLHVTVNMPGSTFDGPMDGLPLQLGVEWNGRDDGTRWYPLPDECVVDLDEVEPLLGSTIEGAVRISGTVRCTMALSASPFGEISDDLTVVELTFVSPICQTIEGCVARSPD